MGGDGGPRPLCCRIGDAGDERDHLHRRVLIDLFFCRTPEETVDAPLSPISTARSPEILFDQGLGDIFDNRVAGNIVDDLLLGSIEFAVEEFRSPLILVLGHERCGAITATIDAIETGGTAPGHIGVIVDALRPIVEPVLDDPGDRVDSAVRANVHAQTTLLVRRSELLAEHVRAGGLRIVGARYDLDNGRVTLLR
jgi:carbonic anhydrase